jgi:hypothetical protein
VEPPGGQHAGHDHEHRQQRPTGGELEHGQGGRQLERGVAGGRAQVAKPAQQGQVLQAVGRPGQQDPAEAPARDPLCPRPVQEQPPQPEHPQPGQHVAGHQVPVGPHRRGVPLDLGGRHWAAGRAGLDDPAGGLAPAGELEGDPVDPLVAPQLPVPLGQQRHGHDQRRHGQPGDQGPPTVAAP